MIIDLSSKYTCIGIGDKNKNKKKKEKKKNKQLQLSLDKMKDTIEFIEF